jgi:hypothetical protein
MYDDDDGFRINEPIPFGNHDRSRRRRRKGALECSGGGDGQVGVGTVKASRSIILVLNPKMEKRGKLVTAQVDRRPLSAAAVRTLPQVNEVISGKVFSSVTGWLLQSRRRHFSFEIDLNVVERI